MKKKAYIAPQSTAYALHTEGSILAGSAGMGLHDDETVDGPQSLSMRKPFPWSPDED